MALNPADDTFVSLLKTRLPAACFKEDTAQYFEEPRGRYEGHGVVLAPASTEEVAIIVKACRDARVGIVPYSGGTGLVGGQIMPDGARPIVLSTERMKSIRAVYPTENVLVADAGVILAEVHRAAEEVDRLFPLSLASEGSARIGGLLATNAGGVNVLRYGNARAQVLGLEVVTADGEIWNGLTRLRKDNTGYALRDLFIGSEGSLGIITAAALKLLPRPAQYGTALLAVPSPKAALDLLALAGSQVGESISAFELIHRMGPSFLEETGFDVAKPFDEWPEWMVLVDLGLPASVDATEVLETLFVAAAEEGYVTDGVIASSEAQRQAFWKIREMIPQGNKRIGSVSSHDISLPLSAIPEFIERGPGELAKLGDMRINCFGHLGDGNLHYNLFPAKGRDRKEYDNIRNDAKKCIHDLVHSYDGSVSAEHGVGRLKVKDVETYSDPAKLAMMRAIKTSLDPLGIMNPGVVLRAAD
ncbi:FAD-binding oxidoreductase [Marivivens sp. LCG002]|uniref:FAD-binding oxidoreductase n=1 Tax=Marivivens sp. LCG002 TaxID=3051171 RepID=UPI0025543660|nr:FAD-binding oxidoreductase [Marivivens sp. LCG002]WIV50300.1 FAD-binding oxidoreductase [Marivivens sp. LCG002]